MTLDLLYPSAVQRRICRILGKFRRGDTSIEIQLSKFEMEHLNMENENYLHAVECQHTKFGRTDLLA